MELGTKMARFAAGLKVPVKKSQDQRTEYLEPPLCVRRYHSVCPRKHFSMWSTKIMGSSRRHAYFQFSSYTTTSCPRTEG